MTQYFHYSETCIFTSDKITATSSENLGPTHNAYVCVTLVKSTRPSAIGLTWFDDGGNECLAHFGTPFAFEKSKGPGLQSCLFSGRYVRIEYQVL